MLHISKYYLGLQGFVSNCLQNRSTESLKSVRKKKLNFGQSLSSKEPRLLQTRWLSNTSATRDKSLYRLSIEDDRQEAKSSIFVNSDPVRKPVTRLHQWSAEDYFNGALEQFSKDDALIVKEESAHIAERLLTDESPNWYALFQHFEARLCSKAGNLIKFLQHLRKLYTTFKSVELDDVEMPSRNAPEYQYLTDPKLMKEALNTFKPLPARDLQGSIGHADTKHFFVSKNGLQIWEQYFAASQDPERYSKIALSGPHGVGKSVIGLMIATAAYAMHLPLFYYPNCGIVLTKQQVIRTFYKLNKDLIETNKVVAKVFETLLGDHWTNLHGFWRAFTLIPGAVMILDEQQEVYRNHEYTTNHEYITYTSFQTFACANFLMFIGLHSEPEETLLIDNAYIGSFQHLRPLALDEYKYFLTEPNSPMSNFPWIIIPGATVDEKVALLYLHFGGLPQRVINYRAFLLNGGKLETFQEVLTLYYYAVLESIRQEGDHEKEIAELVRSLQYDGTVGRLFLYRLTSVLYARGLLYYDKGKYVPVDQTAAKAMLAVLKP